MAAILKSYCGYTIHIRARTYKWLTSGAWQHSLKRTLPRASVVLSRGQDGDKTRF